MKHKPSQFRKQILENKQILNSITNATIATKRPIQKEPLVKKKFNLLGSISFAIKSRAKKMWAPITKFVINHIKKPYQDYLRNKANAKTIKDLKSEFSKTFEVNHSDILTLMSGYSTTDIASLRADLISGAIECNKVSMRDKPFLYEPTINDIHNENLNPNNKTIKEIKESDTELANFLLRSQVRASDIENGNSTRIKMDGPSFDDMYKNSLLERNMNLGDKSKK